MVHTVVAPVDVPDPAATTRLYPTGSDAVAASRYSNCYCCCRTDNRQLCQPRQVELVRHDHRLCRTVLTSRDLKQRLKRCATT